MCIRDLQRCQHSLDYPERKSGYTFKVAMCKPSGHAFERRTHRTMDLHSCRRDKRDILKHCGGMDLLLVLSHFCLPLI
uniref:Uncharacterized protein n=1 Tax=Anguilla anguilla TaxID=7936 RepID=A0A0E9QRI8_ANGAN